MVFCFDEGNSKIETMTKEQIISAITQAVNNGSISNIDTGFVTTVREQNRNSSLKFWLGTQAEYNALSSVDSTTVYIITDEDSVSSVESLVSSLSSSVTELGNRVNAGVPEKNKLLLSTPNGAVVNTQYTVNGITDYQFISIIFDWEVNSNMVSGFQNVGVIACIKNTTNSEASIVHLRNSEYQGTPYIRMTVASNRLTFNAIEVVRKYEDDTWNTNLKVKAVYGVC